MEEESDIAAFKDYTADSSFVNEPISQPEAPQKETKKEAPKKSVSTSYPEHLKLSMPALSPTMTAGKISQWIKKEGESVSAGDVICEVETDKASVGYEIQEDGVIAKILAPEGGNDISIGEPLAILVFSKDDVKAFDNYQEGADSQASQPEPEVKKASQQATQKASPQTGDRVFISPLAKGAAENKGIPIADLKGHGSGPLGRVIYTDVINFSGSTSAQPKAEAVSQPSQQKQAAPKASPSNIDNPYVDIPLTNMRKVIATRLLESKTTIPHYYLTLSITMDQLLQLRGELNKEAKVKISVNDLIIKAASLACRDVPEANSQWHKDFIRKFKHCDVSMAVATDNGLITPIVFSAETLGLSEIAAKTKELAVKARENKLQPQEFVGGTFTISNLGNFGIEHFCAVINPPQVFLP